MVRKIPHIVIMLLIFATTSINLPPARAQSPQVEPPIAAAVAGGERVRVVITLRDPVALTAPLAERRAQIDSTQAALLTTLADTASRVVRQFETLPGIIAEIDSAALTALLNNPEVVSIQLDQQGGAFTAESVSALRADIVRTTYGLTGAGVRVAVLDSGIDTDHADLADDLIGQACFTGGGVNGTCPPNLTTTGSSAEDQNGHGTNVTGIITSRGTVAPIGFAPDADIIAIRVLDNFGSGWLSDWTAALDYLIANQAALQVDLVNMSLGSYSTYAPFCDAANSLMANAVDQLTVNHNVAVFAATGNAGNPYTTSVPACIANVIAVVATYDSELGREPDTGTWRTRFGGGWPPCFDAVSSLNQVTCFSNGGASVDLAAPGAWITSTGMGGGIVRYTGTSQASPTAVGVAALLLQARPDLTVARLEEILKLSGVLIPDARSGEVYPRIDALAAVERALHVTDTPIQSAPLNNSVTPPLPTFTWSAVPEAEGYYLWLSRSDGAKVYDLWYYNPSAFCSGGVCSVTPGIPLASGGHRWWVQAHSRVFVYSAWSPVGDFTVATEQPLPAMHPVPLSPTGASS